MWIEHCHLCMSLSDLVFLLMPFYSQISYVKKICFWGKVFKAYRFLLSFKVWKIIIFTEGDKYKYFLPDLWLGMVLDQGYHFQTEDGLSCRLEISILVQCSKLYLQKIFFWSYAQNVTGEYYSKNYTPLV